MHTPVPLVMVTAFPATEQAPTAVIVAMLVALDVAETTNVDRYLSLIHISEPTRPY